MRNAQGGVFSSASTCQTYFNQQVDNYTYWCGLFPSWPVCSTTPTTAPSVSPGTTVTPTEGPTPTPIQTHSPDGTRLGMTVFLQGIGRGGDNVTPGGSGNPDPFRLQRPITVEMYDTSNVLKATASGIVLYNAQNGNYVGTIEPSVAVPAGPYSARVIVPGYLAQNISQYFQVTPSALITLPPVTLITGDINSDNVLSILDYNILLGCYSNLGEAKDCDALRKRISDLNDDGRVDGIDYNLFIRTMAVQRGSGGAGYSTVNNNPPPPSPTATPTPTTIPTVTLTDTPTVSPFLTPTDTPSPTQ